MLQLQTCTSTDETPTRDLCSSAQRQACVSMQASHRTSSFTTTAALHLASTVGMDKQACDPDTQRHPVLQYHQQDRHMHCSTETKPQHRHLRNNSAQSLFPSALMSIARAGSERAQHSLSSQRWTLTSKPTTTQALHSQASLVPQPPQQCAVVVATATAALAVVVVAIMAMGFTRASMPKALHRSTGTTTTTTTQAIQPLLLRGTAVRLP